MLSSKFFFLLANVVLLKSISAYEATNSEAKDDLNMRAESDYPEQYNNDGGNVKDGQSIKGDVLGGQLLNNVKAGKRKRYVDMNDYERDMRSFGDDPEQYNNGGGNVKDGEGIFGSVLSPQAANNVKAGKRKRYVDMDDINRDMRSFGNDPEQYNNDGGNVKDGQSIKGEVLSGQLLNNVKAGKRKRYADMTDYNRKIRSTDEDLQPQYNNGGGNVKDGEGIFGSVLSPQALNNVKAGKRKRYVDMNDYNRDMRSFGDDPEQYNNDGGNVKDGQSIKGEVLSPNALNNIKAGKRKRYVNMSDYNQNMRSFGDDPEQYNNDGGNVDHGQGIKGDVLGGQALNNVKAGKRKRYVDMNDLSRDMRSTDEDLQPQYNNGGGNAKDGQSIYGSVLSPQALNNVKAGKRKRYVDMNDINRDMRSFGNDPEQYNNDGGNVKDGQSIKGEVLSPNVGNNLKLGKRKRYVDMNDLSRDMRSTDEDLQPQYNNGGGNAKDGQSIYGSVLSPQALNNVKAGKRKRYVDMNDINRDMRSFGNDPEQYNNDGGNVKDGQSIKGEVLSPNVGNNLKLGKRKRYVDMNDLSRDMRSTDEDLQPQYNNGGGNAKDGQSIYGSVLSPQALNNVKAGKR